ncbi:MAG: hypothetical protein R3E31_11865 [Chloroflexota bacterium]|nr:hypothetical protein [Anaerolineales bacterium]
MMLRRLFGLIITLIALAGLGLSVWGAQVGQRAVDAFDQQMSDVLTLTSQTLDTVEDTLLLTKDTVQTISDSVVTVETTADDVAMAISQTRPLMDQIAAITSDDLPETVEAIQETIPTVAQAAAAIDDTLTTLNRFRIDETIPIINYKIDWSLGIDYAPTTPLDQSVTQIGDSLNDLPGRLRSLEIYVNVANDNLETIGDDVTGIADDLAAVNAQIAELNPLLDDYMTTVLTLNDNSRQTRASISEQLESVKLGITVVMIWVGLAQLAPLYLGVELLLGKRRVS